MNLPVDRKDFQIQVKDLRERLNESKINGILDDGFEEQLNKLLNIEKELLAQLIPYYRVYANDITRTSMQLKPIRQLGAYSFDGFLQTTLRINENTFIASSINGKVQFFYMDIADDFSHHYQIEWSPPIKKIQERISFIYQTDDKEILLLGARGGCYLILNFEQIPDINGKIKFKKIQIDHGVSGFEMCLAISKGLFVVESGNEKLNLLELVKDKNVYRLVFHKDIYCTISDWTAWEKISDNYFVVGTKIGELYFIKYEKKQLIITEKIDILNDEIREIRYLENEDGSRNSIMVVGNNGHLKIFSLCKDANTSKIEWDGMKGNLFDVQSNKGTAVVLSEDGIIYLFEENFGNWDLNEEAAIKDVFFTNILELNISKYLLMDVEGRLSLLDIERLDTPEDLWNLPLYR